MVFALLLLSFLPLVGSSPLHPKGSPALDELRKQGNAALIAGRLAESGRIYLRGYGIAVLSRNYRYESIFKSNIASVEYRRFKYQDALNGYLEARALAELSRDPTIQAGIELNLAALYAALGDLSAANRAVTRGLRIAISPEAAHYKLLGCGALLLAKAGNLKLAIAGFREAIREAAQQNDNNAAAQWSDQLGEQIMLGAVPDYPAAEQVFEESLRFRAMSQNRGLRLTLIRLCWLRLEQGDLAEAERLFDRVRKLPANDTGILPWFMHYLHARILRGRGTPREAVVAFREALSAGRAFQKEAAPAGVLGTGAQKLISNLYRDVIAASLEADPRLGLDGFAATEEDRAASLRQTLIGSTAFIEHAAPEYWAALAKLRSAQVDDFTGHNPKTHRDVESLLVEVSELETRAGVFRISTIPTKSSENNTADITLRHIQAGIRPEEVLLSFHLGNSRSVLWAVTTDRIELYRLAPGAQLRAEINAFRSAVESGNPDRDGIGESLYLKLFSGLNPAFGAKRLWLISAEDKFFEIPLGALVVDRKEGKPVYLIERHAILHTPSAIMLNRSPGRAAEGPFLGLGDGVYNGADQRWASDSSWPRPRPKPKLEMVRLPGSGRELAVCARSWGSTPGQILLTGREASRNSVIAMLERRPSVIHFATHFLTLPGSQDDVLIYLGLLPSGEADILNEKDIIGMKAPGAIVAMSGCGSAASRALPMAGVLGLTRAWLIAGARAVLGSRWPTPDDSGEMFESFYSRLRQRKDDPARLRASATSLQEAQIDMLQLGGWRSNPRYWGAFYLLGKE